MRLFLILFTMSARQTSLSASSADPHMRPSQPNLRITGRSIRNLKSFSIITSVIKAESLHKRNIFRQPDPFVVITVDGEQTKTSPVVKGSLSPFWNFTIDVYRMIDPLVTLLDLHTRQVSFQYKFSIKSYSKRRAAIRDSWEW